MHPVNLPSRLSILLIIQDTNIGRARKENYSSVYNRALLDIKQGSIFMSLAVEMVSMPAIGYPTVSAFLVVHYQVSWTTSLQKFHH